MIILYDVSDFLFKGMKAPHSKKWNTKGFPTGGIYNFLTRYFSDFKKKGNLDILIPVFDKGKNYKKVLYPDYKSGRERSDEDKEMYTLQNSFLMEMFEEIGAPYLAIEGYEADDLIYSYVYANKDKIIEVYTSDGDIADVNKLSNKAVMVRTKTKEYVYADEAIRRRIFYGDRSDSYKGLPLYLQPLFDYLYKINDQIYWGNIPSVDLMINHLDVSKEDAEKFYKIVFLATPRITEVPVFDSMQIDNDKLSIYLNSVGLKSFLKKMLNEELNYNRREVRELHTRFINSVSENLKSYFKYKEIVTREITNKILDREDTSIYGVEKDNKLLEW